MTIPSLTPLFVDLAGPIKAAFEWFMNQLLAGIEVLLSMLIGVFLDLLARFVYLEPSRLADLEPIWTLSIGLYFSMLSIVALSALGLVEVFPSSSAIDPYRLGERAFAATLALFVVNPPGGGESLFGKGLFAWAFVLVNEVQRLFLAHAGSGIDLSVSLSGMVSGVAAVSALVFIGYLLGAAALLSIGTMTMLLGLRRILIFAVYGLFPLLILFWVVDVGPPKYANEVAEMAFKAAGILLLAGVLVCGLVATSATLIDGMGGSAGAVEFAGDETATVGDIQSTAGGTFSDADGLADNASGIAEVLTVVIAVVAMSFGGSSILGMCFSMAGVGSAMAGAKRGLSKTSGKAKSALGGDDASSTTDGPDEASAGFETGADEEFEGDATAVDQGGEASIDGDDSAPATMDTTGGDFENPSAIDAASASGDDGAGGSISRPSAGGLAASGGSATGSTTSASASRRTSGHTRSTGGKRTTSGATASSSKTASRNRSRSTRRDRATATDRRAETEHPSLDLSDVETKADLEEELNDTYGEELATLQAEVSDAHDDEDGNEYLKAAAGGAVSDGIGTAATAAGLMAGGPAGFIAAGAMVGAVKSVGGTAVSRNAPEAYEKIRNVGSDKLEATKCAADDLKEWASSHAGKVRQSTQQAKVKNQHNDTKWGK